MTHVPYERYIEDELTAEVVYRELARRERDPANRAVLESLAEQEAWHHEFWRSLAPGAKVSPNWVTVNRTLFLRKILGVMFTVKFLELHEKDIVNVYTKELANMKDERSRESLKKMIAEEEEHEHMLMNRLKEKHVSYLGFIALGLADAIVEITGVHAGFLGITGSTLIAGVSGITVGFAAAISMGSAAYLQAKQDPEKPPLTSAIVTGISYLFSAILLALPYFFTGIMIVAFTASTMVGLLLLAAFTYYGAVLFDRKFGREFLESAALMLGTAFGTYVFGTLVGKAFGINGKQF